MFPLLGNGPNAMVIAGKTSSKQPIEKLFEITSRGSLYTEPSSMSAPQVDVKAQMQLSRRESQHIGFDTHPISSGTNSDFKSVASFSRKMSAEGHAMHNQHHDLLMGASLGDNDSGAETSDYDALDPDPFPSPTSLGTTSADGKRSLSKCSKESPDNGTDLDSCGVKLTVGTSTQATASIANQTLIASPRTAVISRSCSPSNNINQIATASSPSYSFALQSSADLRLASATNFTNSSSRPPGSVSPYLSPPQSPSSESSVGDPRNNHLFQQQHRKRRSSTSTDLAEEGALEDDSKSARDLDDDMDYLAFQTGVVDPSLTGMSAAHYGISAPGSGTTTILDANGMPVGIAVSAGAMDCRNAPGHGQGQGQTVDPEESCPVCGDKVSGYHYGLMTCESCKGFFKRTVQNNKVYQCIENKECRIDKSQRKRCPYCRFQKCLTVGMKLEAVRADRMRGGRNKFGPMYKRDRAIKQQQKAIRAQMIQVAMHGSMHAATSIQIAALAGGAKQNAQNSAGSHLDATQVVLPCPPLAPGSQHTLYCAPVSSGMGIDPSGSLDQLCIKSEPSQSSLPPSVVSCVISTNHNMAGVYANSANYSSHNSSQSGATLMSPTEYQHYITSQQQENHLFSSSPSFPAMIYTGSINNNSLSINNPLKATAASFASNAFHSNAPDIFHHNAAMSYMNGGGTDLTSCKANETPSPPMKQQQQQQNEDYATSMLSGRMPQQQTQLAGLNNNPPKLLLELSTSEPLTETMRARVMSSFHFYMDTPTATPFSLFVKGLEQLLFCFVDWARSSCFFKDLQVEDQMKLLQSSWSNLVLFDHIYRQLKYSSAHSSAPRIVLITGHVLDVRILQLNGLHEAADKFIGLANFLRSVKLDFYEYVAIKFLLLLNPEVSSLSDKMYIERSQQHINSCLMDYCLQTQPQQPDRFQFLILQLKQLSALATCFEEYLLLRQSSGEVPANSLISEMLHASRKRTSAAHTTTTTLSNNTPTGDASPSNTTSTTCSSSNSNSIVIGTERCAADIFSEASHLASSADASSLGTINGTPLAPCTPSVLRSAATTTPQNGGIM